MITIKEYLTEAFNNPYKWQWTQKLPKYMRAAFKDKTNTIYEAYMIREIGESDIWMFMFLGPKGTSNTGLRDQYRVLATITEIIKEWLKESKPQKFTFTGKKEDKHAKLYLAMVKHLGKEIKKLGYEGGSLPDDEKSASRGFAFVRKDS